jgi:hypothetical protein
VLTAVGRGDAGLRWTAATIEGADGAGAALDRVTIPQDVLDRISPTASPRSSLVISDEPLHSETNYHTEFVVVLKDQPQGGLAMRRRSDDVRTAGFGWRGWGFQFDNAPRRGGQYYEPRPSGQYRPQRWW